eukprot:TRINITY_DN6405_c0_g1_i1.p1 TRINITY_DN6405_c0_g1~~TRINITY_DN6405_c0_g1_i1.p1  ORF type:complete len:769 (-),score=34.50 TRINITY_DN6405_c0_g1_i1:335-2494(-)
MSSLPVYNSERKSRQFIKPNGFRIFKSVPVLYCIAAIVAIYLLFQNLIMIQQIALQLNQMEAKISGSSYQLGTDFNNSSKKYFRYAVCNGFTNQRLGIIYGVIMAAQLNRTMIIPQVIQDGLQRRKENIAGNEQQTYPLGSQYNSDAFENILSKHDIQYGKDGGSLKEYTKVSCDNIKNKDQCLKYLAAEFGSQQKVFFQCPFPSISLSNSDIFKNKQLFIEALANLKPNGAFQAKLDQALVRLEYLSGQPKYNVLHVRMETDWIAHCERWQAINDGKIRDNCFTDTFSLGPHLRSKEVEVDIPLYIATNWNLVHDRIKDTVLSSLKEAGYEIVTKTSILLDLIQDLKREELGLMDYFLALNSYKFVGNSVSTFSALVILERRSQGLWSTYYNGGNIPLSLMVPLYKLPWVFTYNSWSTSLDYMLIGAVRSALAHGSLKPYCMYTGNKNASIYKWMSRQGVEIIVHRPSWIIKLAESNTKSVNYSQVHSHLYSNTEGIVGTFQRIDIPILPELMQYDFVLYTDTDVFFRGPVTLDSFPQPLPKAVGMGPEMRDAFPYNAGIALWNLNSLRKTHDQLVEFILTSSDALYWEGYGPVDQGALNKFYEEEIRNWKLPKIFNQKPYHLYQEDAVIVHFHGPKPHHYFQYFQNKTCGSQAFGNLCQVGINSGACFYIVEDWYKYVQDQPVAKQLYSACKIFIEKEINKQQFQRQNNSNQITIFK